MKLEHWALIGGAVVVAVILYANANCATCKAKYTAITNSMGAFPGAGPGVAVN